MEEEGHLKVGLTDYRLLSELTHESKDRFLGSTRLHLRTRNRFRRVALFCRPKTVYVGVEYMSELQDFDE